MIKVNQLCYEYPGKKALDNASFTIEKGGITALVGPNGAGKTTLLRCLAALEKPFSGTITLEGRDIFEQPRLFHQHLGYLSDAFGLYHDLTVRQCLLLAAGFHKLTPQKEKQQIEWVVELLELGDYLSKTAGSLSRGWRQRLGIAQAIIHHPALLLLDEPASGLDPEARITVSRLFTTLRSQGMTLIVSSHILAELEDYCTDMLVIRDGRIMDHRGVARTAADNTIEIVFLEGAQSFIPWLESENVRILAVDHQTITLAFGASQDKQYGLLKKMVQAEAKIVSFSVRQHRLQDIYMALAHTSSQGEQ